MKNTHDGRRRARAPLVYRPPQSVIIFIDIIFHKVCALCWPGLFYFTYIFLFFNLSLDSGLLFVVCCRTVANFKISLCPSQKDISSVSDGDVADFLSSVLCGLDLQALIFHLQPRGGRPSDLSPRFYLVNHPCRPLYTPR